MQSLLRPTLSILAMSLCLALLVQWLDVGLPYGALGTGDFDQYWNSRQLLVQGLNPYDGKVMIEFQRVNGQALRVSRTMWNPPWTTILMSPTLWGSFSSSALAWFCLQIGFLCVIAILAPVALGYPSFRPSRAALVAIFFYPVIDCLAWGQTSIALTLTFCLFLFYESRRMYGAAGAMLSLLSVKPHLFFLFVIPGIKWITDLPKQARHRFVLGLSCGISMLLLATMVMYPGSIVWWVSSFFSAISGMDVVPRHAWKTATLASVIREMISTGSGDSATWFVWIVPAIALIGSSIFFFTRKSPIVWANIAPPLLCVSLVTGSYGWLYDQSLLLVCQFSVLGAAIRLCETGRRYVLLGLAVMIQCLSFMQSMLTDQAQHHFVWIPVVMFALLILARRWSAAAEQERIS